jgi:hypothetical protein
MKKTNLSGGEQKQAESQITRHMALATRTRSTCRRQKNAALLLTQRVCHTVEMSSTVLLVARLHVDLQRVQSAVCRGR